MGKITAHGKLSMSITSVTPNSLNINIRVIQKPTTRKLLLLTIGPPLIFFNASPPFSHLIYLIQFTEYKVVICSLITASFFNKVKFLIPHNQA